MVLPWITVYVGVMVVAEDDQIVTTPDGVVGDRMNEAIKTPTVAIEMIRAP